MIIYIWTKRFHKDHNQSFADCDSDDQAFLQSLAHRIRDDPDVDESMQNFLRAPYVFFEAYKVDLTSIQGERC